jgi:hypothetical protein
MMMYIEGYSVYNKLTFYILCMFLLIKNVAII